MMSAKRVGDVLEGVLGHRIEMNPYGFELCSDDPSPRRARLRCGSGIAGRGRIWALVALPSGTVLVGDIRTKAQLTRAVLEFMAGPPPAPLSDYTSPRARRVVGSSGAPRFVWYRRPLPRPSKSIPRPLEAPPLQLLGIEQPRYMLVDAHTGKDLREARDLEIEHIRRHANFSGAASLGPHRVTLRKVKQAIPPTTTRCRTS